MSPWLILTLVAIPPVDPPVRSYREIQVDVREALRRNAAAQEESQRIDTVLELIGLHHEIVSHPQFATSPALQQYRAMTWSRLRRAKRDLLRRSGTSGSDVSNGGHNLAGAYGGRAGPDDYGPRLVELIERTIAPEFWDVRGGPGTIVYYRPWRVLVVRASDDVHHRIGGLLAR